MTNSNLMEYVTSANGVRIGVELTATAVLLDTVVLSTSRAETLQYVITVTQLMLPFTALDPRYVFDCGSQFNVTFPEEEAPGNWTRVNAKTSTPLALSRAAVGVKS